VGYLYIGRTNVESLIIDTENIEDAEVRELVETGYLAMRAALEAATVQRELEFDKAQAKHTAKHTSNQTVAERIWPQQEAKHTAKHTSNQTVAERIWPQQDD
jgi:hypothetical protein